jgi:hypothetical protein
VAEGHVADEIIEAAISAHAAPVELPQGPPVYRYADSEKARAALGGSGFDLGSVRVETVTAPWRGWRPKAAVTSPRLRFPSRSV